MKHFDFSVVKNMEMMAAGPPIGRAIRGEASGSSADSHRLAEERRDEAALLHDFDALYKRYEKQLFNFIYRYIGDYDEASDVMVQTFTSAFLARESFRGESKLNTWLYRIAQNHCKNRLKQRGRQREVEGPSLDEGFAGDGFDEGDHGAPRDIADWSGSPARALEQKELGALIDKIVDNLAPEYKVVLLLREMEGMAYAEIAQATGLTMEAVKTRLNRARAMVRQRLEPYLTL